MRRLGIARTPTAIFSWRSLSSASEAIGALDLLIPLRPGDSHEEVELERYDPRAGESFSRGEKDPVGYPFADAGAQAFASALGSQRHRAVSAALQDVRDLLVHQVRPDRGGRHRPPAGENFL